ncbi:MAG: hypothetical protein WA160_02285 [Pseudobdellovibrio sp.]
MTAKLFGLLVFALFMTYARDYQKEMQVMRDNIESESKARYLEIFNYSKISDEFVVINYNWIISSKEQIDKNRYLAR